MSRGDWLVESKSLKLFLTSFRNHGAFHEACTVGIAKRLMDELEPVWLRIGGYWYPRGGIPIDVFYQTGPPPDGVWSRPGRGPLSWTRLTTPRSGSATGRWRSASTPWASRRPPSAMRRASGWATSWPQGRTATWAGWSRTPTAAGDPAGALAGGAHRHRARHVLRAARGPAGGLLEQPDRGIDLASMRAGRDYHDVVKSRAEAAWRSGSTAVSARTSRSSSIPRR